MIKTLLTIRKWLETLTVAIFEKERSIAQATIDYNKIKTDDLYAQIIIAKAENKKLKEDYYL